MEGSVIPEVRVFFDESTRTATYLVVDPDTKQCAIIDPVLDYNADTGRTATLAAERVARAVKADGLTVAWLLETHVHADHLSAAPWLQSRLGGRTGIGKEIAAVQQVFAELYNLGPGFVADGREFNHLFADGERFEIGALQGRVLHTPGHTPADVSYLIGDTALVGDTLFMPDYGTARADFPGGDARTLYRSIQKILALPPETRVFTAHDYKAPGRDDFAWESTVADQRAANVHVHEGVTEEAFVALRTTRDATLAMPALLLPAVQVNIRAGRLPEPERNGRRYLRIPLDSL